MEIGARGGSSAGKRGGAEGRCSSSKAIDRKSAKEKKNLRRRRELRPHFRKNLFFSLSLLNHLAPSQLESDASLPPLRVSARRLRAGSADAIVVSAPRLPRRPFCRRGSSSLPRSISSRRRDSGVVDRLCRCSRGRQQAASAFVQVPAHGRGASHVSRARDRQNASQKRRKREGKERKKSAIALRRRHDSSRRRRKIQSR